MFEEIKLENPYNIKELKEQIVKTKLELVNDNFKLALERMETIMQQKEKG